MSLLKSKKILIGITGGIAAYKSVFIVRDLIKRGAEVKVIMTKSAQDFVSSLTLATLSKNPVLIDFIREENHIVDWNNHIDLALWADILVIAPTTSNTLSKIASGRCDNLLMAVYQSFKSQVYIAPAMDLDMYRHPSTKENLKKLTDYSNLIIPPNTGELASGLYGEGRMAEPHQIIDFIENDFYKKSPLRGKSILITAGTTHEPIDPVRFLSNNSSGKMGFSLVEKTLQMGAEVTLITGPTKLSINSDKLLVEKVVTAEQMFERVRSHYKNVDIIIMAAAVADYKPAKKLNRKIKKKQDTLTLDLIPTKDILSFLGKNKKENQFLVGFALETDNALENATNKLISKNLDAIVLNSLEDLGSGFGVDTNKITIIDKTKKQHPFTLKSKKEVAQDIISFIIEKINLPNH